MKSYFECKIRYRKTLEDGMEKKVTESYLVDALSFTEAEARIIREMTPYISGEFTVTDIKRAAYSEVLTSDMPDDDRWFKCKLTFITLDEKSGEDKRSTTHILVQACDLREAVKRIDEGMKDTLADYEITSLAETAIVEVYPYQAEEPKPESGNAGDQADGSPSIVQFLSSLPDGCRSEFIIDGKPVIIDKTGRGTKVIPGQADKEKEADSHAEPV